MDRKSRQDCNMNEGLLILSRLIRLDNKQFSMIILTGMEHTAIMHNNINNTLITVTIEFGILPATTSLWHKHTKP